MTFCLCCTGWWSSCQALALTHASKHTCHSMQQLNQSYPVPAQAGGPAAILHAHNCFAKHQKTIDPEQASISFSSCPCTGWWASCGSARWTVWKPLQPGTGARGPPNPSCTTAATTSHPSGQTWWVCCFCSPQMLRCADCHMFYNALHCSRTVRRCGPNGETVEQMIKCGHACTHVLADGSSCSEALRHLEARLKVLQVISSHATIQQAFLDQQPFLRSRLHGGTKCSEDPFLCALTPDGIPIEEATTTDLRRGGWPVSVPVVVVFGGFCRFLCSSCAPSRLTASPLRKPQLQTCGGVRGCVHVWPGFARFCWFLVRSCVGFLARILLIVCCSLSLVASLASSSMCLLSGGPLTCVFLPKPSLQATCASPPTPSASACYLHSHSTFPFSAFKSQATCVFHRTPSASAWRARCWPRTAARAPAPTSPPAWAPCGRSGTWGRPLGSCLCSRRYRRCRWVLVDVFVTDVRYIK